MPLQCKISDSSLEARIEQVPDGRDTFYRINIALTVGIIGTAGYIAGELIQEDVIHHFRAYDFLAGHLSNISGAIAGSSYAIVAGSLHSKRASAITAICANLALLYHEFIANHTGIAPSVEYPVVTDTVDGICYVVSGALTIASIFGLTYLKGIRQYKTEPLRESSVEEPPTKPL